MGMLQGFVMRRLVLNEVWRQSLPKGVQLLCGLNMVKMAILVFVVWMRSISVGVL